MGWKEEGAAREKTECEEEWGVRIKGKIKRLQPRARREWGRWEIGVGPGQAGELQRDIRTATNEETVEWEVWI
jgi:hypothetical protein